MLTSPKAYLCAAFCASILSAVSLPASAGTIGTERVPAHVATTSYFTSASALAVPAMESISAASAPAAALNLAVSANTPGASLSTAVAIITPEPGTLAMTCLSLCALGWFTRKRFAKA